MFLIYALMTGIFVNIGDVLKSRIKDPQKHEVDFVFHAYLDIGAGQVQAGKDR